MDDLFSTGMQNIFKNRKMTIRYLLYTNKDLLLLTIIFVLICTSLLISTFIVYEFYKIGEILIYLIAMTMSIIYLYYFINWYLDISRHIKYFEDRE